MEFRAIGSPSEMRRVCMIYYIVPIFRIQKNTATQIPVKDDGFGTEFNLRDFFADNLVRLLGITFLEKEYSTTDGRIDTLGLDENNSPVIIEYKKKENDDVLSQGLFYFDWLVKNKKHFELLVGSKLGKDIQVNWDQPRVILIAQGFNRYIIAAVRQLRNIELKTYTYYNSDILHVENIYSPHHVKLTKKEEPKEEIPEYDLDYHLKSTSKEIQDKFNQLREMILDLPEVEERLAQKSGITYRTTKSFVRFEFRPSWIQVLLRDPKYQLDSKNLVRDVTTHEWGYKGMVKFNSDITVDDMFSLVKQSYESTL